MSNVRLLFQLSVLLAACTSNGSQRTATPPGMGTGVAAPEPEPVAMDPAVVAHAHDRLIAALDSVGSQPRLLAFEVDIFEVMGRAGFERAVEDDLADYLPLPPRASGQVGRFVRAGEPVSVTRITYVETLSANRHEDWFQERRAILTGAHERVVRYGPTVIHIVAQSAAAAADATAAFSGLPGAQQ
jgi:hypothetical protein